MVYQIAQHENKRSPGAGGSEPSVYLKGVAPCDSHATHSGTGQQTEEKKETSHSLYENQKKRLDQKKLSA